MNQNGGKVVGKQEKKEEESVRVQLKIQFQKMYCTGNAFRTSDILHMNPCQKNARLLSFTLPLPPLAFFFSKCFKMSAPDAS